MIDKVVTTVWSGEQLSLGEGPLAHHLRSSLVWCDINGSAVYEKSFSGGEARRFDFPVLPSAAGIIDERSILVATERDFRVLDLDPSSDHPLECGECFVGQCHEVVPRLSIGLFLREPVSECCHLLFGQSQLFQQEMVGSVALNGQPEAFD